MVPRVQNHKGLQSGIWRMEGLHSGVLGFRLFEVGWGLLKRAGFSQVPLMDQAARLWPSANQDCLLSKETRERAQAALWLQES